MGRRQIAEIGPQRIRGDVGDDHWLCTVSGRPARTNRRADDGTIDCLSVGFWQAGRRAVPKAVGTRVQQKDRTQRTTGQFFDEQACALQDELARIPPGDHLEKPFLPGQQYLRPLAFGHVYRCTDVFQEIAGYVANGVTRRADVLNRSPWKNDSEIHVEVGVFVQPFKNRSSAYPVSILWMNTLVKRFV